MEPEREQQMRDLMALGATAFEKPDVPAAQGHYREAIALAMRTLATRELALQCREYLLALLLLEAIFREQAEQKDAQHRMAELAAWATHCNLQPPHQALTLKRMFCAALL